MCLHISQSLSLIHTHTHTHTESYTLHTHTTQTVTQSYTQSLSLSLSNKKEGERWEHICIFFPTNHVLLKQFHTYYQSVYAKLFTSQEQQVKFADTTLIRKQDITCSNLTSTLQVTCYSRCGKKKKNVPRHSIQQHTHTYFITRR